jgi:hypothetical protein
MNPRRHTKGLEALRYAQARKDARKALSEFLGASEGLERIRLLAAFHDASCDALADAEGPLATACRLYAKGGRIAPVTHARQATQDAGQALFRTRAA